MAPSWRSEAWRTPGGRRSARSGRCSGCCATRTRSSRSLRSRRSPTSPISSRASARRACRSSSTPAASTCRSRPASTSPPIASCRRHSPAPSRPRAHGPRRYGCATPPTSSASRSPTSATPRPTASAHCSACTSASRCAGAGSVGGAGRRLGVRGAGAAPAGGGVMRPRTLDLVLTAAVFATSVGESLLSAGVDGPRWAAAALSGGMSLTLLGRRSHPVAMALVLLALVLPTAAFLVDPSELISTFFPLLILAYSGGVYASPRGGAFVLGLLVAGVVAVGLLDASHQAADLYFPAIIVSLCWIGGRTVRT